MLGKIAVEEADILLNYLNHLRMMMWLSSVAQIYAKSV